MRVGAEAFGELVLDPDRRAVAVGRRRRLVLLGLIAPGAKAAVQIGPLAPGVGPGEHVAQFFVTRQRTDVITCTVVRGFVAQGAAFGNRLAPVAGQRIQLLRAIGGDHAGIQHRSRKRRTFVVTRQQAEPPALGLALPAQADVGVLTVVDHRRVR